MKSDKLLESTQKVLQGKLYENKQSNELAKKVMQLFKEYTRFKL